MCHPVSAGVEQLLALRVGQGAQGCIRGISEQRQLLAEIGWQRLLAVALQKGLPIIFSKRTPGGPIPTRQRRPARWADSHAAASPGKVGRFPYRHVCSLCYPWIVQLSGSLVVWRSVPRNRPRAAANAQYGAATRRRAAVPARRRAAPTAHPRGGRTAAVWR